MIRSITQMNGLYRCSAEVISRTTTQKLYNYKRSTTAKFYTIGSDRANFIATQSFPVSTSIPSPSHLFTHIQCDCAQTDINSCNA